MSKNYVVSLPQFHVEADSKQEAAEQAIQTFLDYTSSRNCDVREFGKEYTMKFDPLDLDKQEIFEEGFYEEIRERTFGT
jgi:hypothetical protein